MWGYSKPLSFLLLFTVVSLFFWPLAYGSFQSTHGPTTTTLKSGVANEVVFFVVAVLVPIMSGLGLVSLFLCVRQIPTSATEPLISSISLRC
jgi:hypothetical protein